jgi:hypothetical protein
MLSDLLMKVLENDLAKQLLVSAVCAMEKCDFETQMLLMKMSPSELTRTLISGVWLYEGEEDYLFAPYSQFHLHARHRHCHQRPHAADKSS